MANKKKTTKTSTRKGVQKKSTYTYLGEIYDLETFRKRPVSLEWLELFADKFLKTIISNEEIVTITQAHLLCGIYSDTIRAWRKRSKKFDEAYKFAKECIGARREAGAIRKKYDATMIARSMPIYDKAWKKLEEWRASLKNKEEEEKVTTFNINIPRFKNNEKKVVQVEKAE
jgi:hypothetical protein